MSNGPLWGKQAWGNLKWGSLYMWETAGEDGTKSTPLERVANEQGHRGIWEEVCSQIFPLVNPVPSPYLTFPEANSNVIKLGWNLPFLTFITWSDDRKLWERVRTVFTEQGPVPCEPHWKLGALNDWAYASLSRNSDAELQPLRMLERPARVRLAFVFYVFIILLSLLKKTKCKM